MPNKEESTILQIIPATPGWRAVWVNEDGSIYFEDIPGWALVEVSWGTGSTRVVRPLVPSEVATQYDADDIGGLLGTIGPNATEEEIAVFRREAAARMKQPGR